MSEWKDTLYEMPPKDGSWAILIFRDFCGATLLQWDESEGEWVEPDCKNTGFDDDYVITTYGPWIAAPKWMVIGWDRDKLSFLNRGRVGA